MKNTIVSIISFSFLFVSCDKINDPIIKQTSDNELIAKYSPTQNYEPYIFDKNTNTNRNILIEDYTGHLCNNCPPAAVIAKNIETSNPERVFVLSVHAGGATNTFQTVTGKFKTDYTTHAGTEYTIQIPGFNGNPSGMISRTTASGSLWLSKDVWSSQVSALLSENKLKGNIQIKTDFFPSTGGVFVNYEVEAVEDLDASTKVLIFLAEKKIISPQKLEDSSTDELYEHHNVMSGLITNTILNPDGKTGNSSIWGESIGANGLLSGEKIQGLAINGINEMNIRRVINEDGGNDLIVFALLVNDETKEIYQVVTEEITF